MFVTQESKLKKIVVIGDRVLIKPKAPSEMTSSGLYLPPSVQEKEKIQQGYVVKVGPGYPIPLPTDDDELWKGQEEAIKYIPLQVKEGDLAIFLLKGAIELQYENEQYYMVSQNAILMIERDDELFD
ncbi:co-chaperone GroES [Eisenibacter elegans]|jgi:co-chaperonin GroES (HSP10)|uniref:co-chaperone GroES n=1 Tax=Eisenibacter elegans TaxID=997 RepID=UPI00040585F9|nr:co-chaperone GroES family protein [Eisenibacter elegans]